MKLTKRLLLLISGLFLMLVGVACQPITAPTPTPSPQEEAMEIIAELSLIGSSWQVESFGDSNEPVTVISDTRPTLNFGIQRYGGNGGCNWFLGAYIVDGEFMRFRTPSKTLATCGNPEGVMSQEATYLSVLLNIIEYKRDGEKLVGYTTDDQQLVTFVPATTVDFIGTEWELRFISNGSRQIPTIPEGNITAVFDDGAITGSAGCNDYNASYTLDGEDLSVGVAISTQKMCIEPDGVMEQEQLYLDTLQSATRLVQTGGMLQAINESGETVLTFGAR